MTLCMNTMTPPPLATPEGGRRMNSYPATTGGRGCPVTWRPTSLPATLATQPNVPGQTSRYAPPQPDPRPTVASHLCRHDHGTPGVSWIRQHQTYSRPFIHTDPCTDHDHHYRS